MNIELEERLRQYKYTPRQFFQIAYMAWYGKYHDPTPEAREYTLNGVIPYYVSWYLNQLGSVL